jgi:GNAT superfamily N-acetyltransferase
MIRRADPRDEEPLLGLAREFATSFEVDAAAFRASFAALLADPHAFLAVAEAGDTVIGYVLAFSHVTLYANGRVAWVEELMVDAGCRKQGVGRVLIQSAEAWAEERGCRLVALATRRAAAFYEALEYEPSATYYRKLLDRDPIAADGYGALTADTAASAAAALPLAEETWPEWREADAS